MKSIVALARSAPLLTVAALVGCDNGAVITTTASASVPLEGFPAQYAQAFCAQNFKCCSLGDIDGRTMQQCNDDNTTGLMLLSTLVSDGQANNRISYDGAKMAMCLTAVKQLTCEDWRKGLTLWTNQPAACQAAIVPRVAVGGSCQEDIECTTGRCAGADSSVTPPVDGKCMNLLPFAASCAGGLSCADDLYCDEASNQCLARKAAGQSCTFDEECMNSCNATTGICSAYAGCAAGASAPRPALLSLAFVGAVILLGKRRVRRAQRFRP